MERRRTSVRHARLGGVALLVLTAATACGGDGLVGRAPAATVNGTEISTAQVEELIEAQRDYYELARANTQAKREQALADAEANGTDPGQIPSEADLDAQFDDQLAPFLSVSEGTVPAQGVAQVLTTLVSLEIDREVLRAAGGTVTEEQRTTARTSIESSIEEDGIDLEEVPEALLEQATEQGALQSALEATVPDDVRASAVLGDDEYTAQLQALYEEQVASKLCVNVIIADEATAATALQRVRDGEAFTDVAADVSTAGPEAAVDGGGGCFGPDDAATVLGDDAATAGAGDLLGPVVADPAAGTFAAVEVAPTPTFDAIRPQLEQDNPNTSEEDAAAAVAAYLGEQRAEAAADADVTVSGRYGTWDPERGAVSPPVDPLATTTTADPLALDPAAIDPAAVDPAAAGS